QVSAIPDLRSDNNTVTFTTRIVAAQPPNSTAQMDKLSVAFTAIPATAQVGETVTLQVAVTNTTSDETLYNVEAFSPLRGWIQDLVLTWPNSAYPGRLLPGETAVGSFPYLIPANFTYTHRAWATADDSEPLGESFVSVNTILTQAQLDVIGPGLSITVSGPNSAQVGETAHFTIAVRNESARSDSAANPVLTE